MRARQSKGCQKHGRTNCMTCKARFVKTIWPRRTDVNSATANQDKKATDIDMKNSTKTTKTATKTVATKKAAAAVETKTATKKVSLHEAGRIAAKKAAANNDRKPLDAKVLARLQNDEADILAAREITKTEAAKIAADEKVAGVPLTNASDDNDPNLKAARKAAKKDKAGMTQAEAKVIVERAAKTAKLDAPAELKLRYYGRGKLRFGSAIQGLIGDSTHLVVEIKGTTLTLTPSTSKKDTPLSYSKGAPVLRIGKLLTEQGWDAEPQNIVAKANGETGFAVTLAITKRETK